MNVGTYSEQLLLDIISKSGCLQEIIDRAPELNLPQWHVGAGCIAQTVWNYKHGYDLLANIKDCDFVYYDTDLSEQKEKSINERVKKIFSHLPIELDVVNQARVHIWYTDHFGYAIKPYQSIKDAIATWPTTATSVGISRINNSLKVHAPYGLDDLLNMVVRANKKQITEDIYMKKVARWIKAWPQLTVISWASNF